MGLKGFIVELGMGADLHRENVTAAACRAVNERSAHLFHFGNVKITPQHPDCAGLIIRYGSSLG
ncbi:MAG: Lin0512 family protein [Deltaproteobacteria bacterium]|nr:Lin0512 family protein [Deltaproteobacteria bacterium]